MVNINPLAYVKTIPSLILVLLYFPVRVPLLDGLLGSVPRIIYFSIGLISFVVLFQRAQS